MEKQACVAHNYPGPERRQCPLLDPAEVEKIAERAAELAVEKMTQTAYQAVGKSVIQRLFWIVGVLAVMAYLWAASNGYIKP